MRPAPSVIGVLLLAVIWRGVHASGQIAIDLLFGWIGFLARVLPNVDGRLDGWLVFGGGVLLATVIAHWLLRWLHRQWYASMSAPGRWRFRWTLSLMSLVMVLFAAGTCMVGATHQAAWLAASDSEWFGRTIDSPPQFSRSNLQSLGLAVDNCASTHGLPHYALLTQSHPHSWVVPLLPYIGGGYLPDDVDMNRPWNHPDNRPAFQRLVPDLINPALRNAPLRDGEGFGLNHYAGNSALFESDRPLDWDSLRGKSNLLLIGEVNAELVAWGHPDNSRDPAAGFDSPGGFGGPYGSTGVHFVMADRSVREIDRNVDPEVLRRLSRVEW